MPAALSVSIRQAIVERRQRGERFTQIATALGLPYDSVRQIWQHWQRHGTLSPRYAACRHPGARKPAAVLTAALDLKRQHPRWGAVMIRLALLETFAADDVPAERTLQSWFRQAGLNRSPAQQQPRTTVARGAAVHEVWAVDAKEQMTLADGSGASWLTVSDEASGAILHAEAFPPQGLVAGEADDHSSDVAAGVGAVGTPGQDAL